MSGTPAARASERFSGASAMINLAHEAEELLGRAADSQNGHAQRALYRHGGKTIALFALIVDATLPPHAADGVVSVHVLRGRVVMNAGEARYDAPPGSLVRLKPKVVHDVRAEEDSVILVHISKAPPRGTL